MTFCLKANLRRESYWCGQAVHRIQSRPCRQPFDANGGPSDLLGIIFTKVCVVPVQLCLILPVRSLNPAWNYRRKLQLIFLGNSLSVALQHRRRTSFYGVFIAVAWKWFTIQVIKLSTVVECSSSYCILYASLYSLGSMLSEAGKMFYPPI
jgi:hypothetical protein